MPAISLVAITLLNDFVIISVAHDHTVPDNHPKKWNLPRLIAMASVVGFISAMGVIAVYYIYTSQSTTDNYFGLPVSWGVLDCACIDVPPLV